MFHIFCTVLYIILEGFPKLLNLLILQDVSKSLSGTAAMHINFSNQISRAKNGERRAKISSDVSYILHSALFDIRRVPKSVELNRGYI